MYSTRLCHHILSVLYGSTSSHQYGVLRFLKFASQGHHTYDLFNNLLFTEKLIYIVIYVVADTVYPTNFLPA